MQGLLSTLVDLNSPDEPVLLTQLLLQSAQSLRSNCRASHLHCGGSKIYWIQRASRHWCRTASLLSC